MTSIGKPVRLKPGAPVRIDSDLTGVTAITPHRYAQPGNHAAVWERNGDGWRGRISGETDSLEWLLDVEPEVWVLEVEDESAVREPEPPADVEVARVWPRLDGAPANLNAVQGASGRIYRPVRPGSEFPSVTPGRGKRLSTLQEIDGPLVEVFEDEHTGGEH